MLVQHLHGEFHQALCVQLVSCERLWRSRRHRCCVGNITRRHAATRRMRHGARAAAAASSSTSTSVQSSNPSQPCGAWREEGHCLLLLSLRALLLPACLRERVRVLRLRA